MASACLDPRQRWSGTETVGPGTNIEWLMTEGKLAPTTAGAGTPGQAHHIKAQPAGLPSGKGAVVWIRAAPLVQDGRRLPGTVGF